MSVSNSEREATLAAEELQNEAEEVLALQISGAQSAYEDEEYDRHLRFEGFCIGIATMLVTVGVVALLLLLTWR